MTITIHIVVVVVVVVTIVIKFMHVSTHSSFSGRAII